MLRVSFTFLVLVEYVVAQRDAMKADGYVDFRQDVEGGSAIGFDRGL